MIRLPDIFSSRNIGRGATHARRLPVQFSWLLCCLLAASLFAGVSPTFSASLAFAAQVEGEASEPFIDDPNAVLTGDPSLPDRGSEKTEGAISTLSDGSDATDATDGSNGTDGTDGNNSDTLTVVPNNGISIDLSEPETWLEGDTVIYKTTLTVEGADSFYGYQIQVEAANEESIEIVDSFGTLQTEAVYRDGSVYLASMNGAEAPAPDTTQASLSETTSDQAGSGIATCDIIARYPVSDTSTDKQLVVRTFQLVESISPEAMITVGPEPAAAVLDLSLVNIGFAGLGEKHMLFIAAITVGILGIFAAIVLILRERRFVKSLIEQITRPR